MEKRKLLLVIISVGIFLVVAVGASIFVFAPKTGDGQRISGPAEKPIAAGSEAAGLPQNTPASVDASEWVKNPQAVQGLQPPPQGVATTRGDVIIIYGDIESETKTLVGDTADVQRQNMDGNGNLVIEVPRPATPTIPKETSSSISPTGQSKSTGPTAAATATVPAKPAVAPKPAAAPKPAQKTVQTKMYDDYWIQTGSFSAKERADGARTSLGAKGIKSIMEIKDLEGKTYYRVRVGPYTSKNEADYWLSLVKNIDGFDKSYVSMVKNRR
jgi:DedD protein